jgi:hypothetical protein
MLGFITVVHGLAAVAAFANAFPLLVQGLLCGAVGVNLIVLLKRYGFLPGHENKTEVFWDESTGWKLVSGDGTAVPVRLLPSSVVTTVVTVLHFKTERGGRRDVVVFRDAADADSFRRLRIILKTTATNRT